MASSTQTLEDLLGKLKLEEKQATLEVMKLTAWKKGNLEHVMKKCQRDMYADIYDSHRFKYIIKCARRLGKSYLLCLIATIVCLTKKKAQVRYVAPTGKALRKIVHPILEKIWDSAPAEMQKLRPEWKSQDGVYAFKNGAQLHLAGVNNGHADDARGTAADIILVDEAGTIDDLHYLIHDVLLPQLLDPDGKVVQGRKIIIASSPPRTPAHEFTQMAKEAELEGNYSHYTILDGEYPEEIIRLFFKEDGVSDADINAFFSGDYEAIKSTTVLREYLAMDVVDTEFAIVPEWNKKWVMDPVIDDKYKYYYRYVSLDIGVRDLTVALFAHYDFQRACLFVHDEVVMSGPEMTTDKLATAIKLKESLVFRDLDGTVYEPRRRVSDIDLLLLNDLSLLHKLYFDPTDKGRLEEMVNAVRIQVANGGLRVSQRCTQLLGCLAFGVWNEKRTDFDRAPGFGHFDALASLMYMIRNVDYRTNPVPITHNKSEDDYWIEPELKRNRSNAQNLKKAFNIR